MGASLSNNTIHRKSRNINHFVGCDLAHMPVAMMPIGKAGAKNAALFAVQILALTDKNLAKKLVQFKKTQQQKACST
jgi:hypothetical protein